MSQSKFVRRPAALSYSHSSFRRLLIATSQVRLVVAHFGDLSNFTDEDDVAAIVTLKEAAKALDTLYNDMDAFRVAEARDATEPATVFSRLAVLRAQAQGIRAGIEQLRGALPARSNPEGKWDPDDDMANQLESAGKDADSLVGYLTPEDEHVDREIPAGPPDTPRGEGHLSSSSEVDQSDPETPQSPISASEDTADRIRAYLASMRPLRGADLSDEEGFQRGRGVIERLALSAWGTDAPAMVLSVRQCADVVRFLRGVEPIDPVDWWQDPDDRPSHVVGFAFILEAIEECLRRQLDVRHERGGEPS